MENSMNAENLLDSKAILRWVQEKMEKLRLPAPARPKYKDPEFIIPADPSSLTTTELGQRMLQTAGWYAYCQRMFGLCESELVLVDAEFKLKVNIIAYELRKELGRVNQEAIESIAVAKNKEELSPLYERRLQLTAVKKRLESQLLIYERVYQALSREQSRRELEARVSGG